MNNKNLKIGSRGSDVKSLQKRLGITADGIFGKQTAAAVRSFQQKNNLSVDGIAGKNTLGALYKKQGPQRPVQGPQLPAQQGPQRPNPFTQENQIDISKVVPDVKVINEPVFEQAAPNEVQAPQFLDVNTQEPEPQPGQELLSQAEKLRSEIKVIEDRTAARGGQRTDALEDAGVFEDLQRLNDLKAKLQEAEDRQIEIPIEERQNLRGRQATKTEFNQATRPKLENALLEELTASRATSRLTDTINTNIQIIDDQINAAKEADEILYKQKAARLENIETVYGDIMTEQQKLALEDKKFENELLLASAKSNNDLRADLIKDIAGKGVGGVQLNGLMSASIDDLISMQGELVSPARWSEMSFEEAAMTLDKDSFKQFEAYREWEKTATEEEKSAVTEAVAAQESAKGIITTVESLLNDKNGLDVSVGVTSLGRTDFFDPIFGIGEEGSQFRANAKKLVSQKTLDTLVALKQTGATLGAISEKELEILTNANLALGAITDENGNQTGKFNMKEKDFKEALKTIRTASMKTYIAAAIGKEAYQRANYLNADFDTIQKRYDDLIVNGAQGTEDFAENELAGIENTDSLGAAFELIAQEEGFREQAYQDQTGKWTIGFGTTMINGRPVQPGDRLSREQSTSIMQEQIIDRYTSFADKIPQAELTPQQFAALTSFEYNLGPGVWNQPSGSRILDLVDRGQYTQAAQLMQQFNKSRDPNSGQLAFNQGLANRRAREGQLLIA